MNVILKSLTLINFKGIRELTVSFKENTVIYGANGLGKTTIFDAVIWLLFGKDSTGRKDFNIKTLDSSNKAIEKLDHEVTGVLYVDGKELILRRAFKEKWVKKRGSEEAEFTGHETLFFINHAQYQAGEYESQINKIMEESLFKLVTSPFFFNSLKWEERRNVLSELVGNISDQEVGEGNPKFLDLLGVLTNKPLEQFKREIAGKKKLTKDTLETLPVRISEAQRGIVTEPDYEEINRQIGLKTAQIQSIDEQIEDKSKTSQAVYDEQMKDLKEINDLKVKLSQIKFNASQEAQKGINEKRGELNTLNTKLTNLQNDYNLTCSRIQNLETGIAEYTTNKENALKQWYEVNDRTLTFNEEEFICPTCKRPFEATDVESKKEELTAQFNAQKDKDRAKINEVGVGYANMIKKLTSELEEKKALQSVQYRDLEGLKISVKTLSDSIPATAPEPVLPVEYAEIEKQIFAIESKPKAQPADTSDLKNQKRNVQLEIDTLKSQLLTKDVVAKAKARVEELKAEEKQLAQSLADLERQEFVILDFEKAKIDRIEAKVNSLFSYVQFKMFKKNINGGVEPCCDTLINGVPWQDANNAARVNGGLDIIRTLCKHYNVSAPVFADNAESVNDIIPMDSQMVKLVVTTDPELKIA